MARCQLRVYFGPEEGTSVDSEPHEAEQRVTVPLRDMLGR